ncbi:MAG: glycosyltransferase, partial [Chloroflexi bacterium]|nr:glycosyltransferase [Chloroflexota bacterium]
MYTQRLAESLVAEGHKVIIHTTNALELEAIWNPRKARNTAFRESTPNLEIWRHPLHYLPLAPYSFYLLRRLMIALSSTSIIPTAFLSLLARYAPWLPQLEKTLKRWDGPLDLIHALSIPFEPLIMAAASGADHLGVPLVVTPFFHIGETANNHVSRSCTMRHQVELLQRCNAVITLTESEKEFLAGLG